MMQTIWSRIAQAGGGCRCPHCLHSLQGVSRRATASATSRAPKYLTSSTLWYSGIFAAAATYDAAAKKRRREQWDRAIAGAQQDVKLPVEEEKPRLAEEDADRSGIEALIGVPDVFDDLERQQRGARWPVNTGRPLREDWMPAESIYATEGRKERARRTRWSPKKLETVALSVDILQLKLYLESQNQGWDREASHVVPDDYRIKMSLTPAETLATIERKKIKLRSLWDFDPQLSGYKRSDDDVQLSSYREDDLGHYHDAVRSLNAHFRALFYEHKDGAISTGTLLAKLAYNLSASSAPPNTATYNTLLLGLSRAQQPTQVYQVIRSLRETHIRPNEITNATILQHYAAQDDVDMFVRWVGLMRGKGSGLALARPDITITLASEGRLVESPERPGRIIQLPYPTPNVFGALIQGVLKFAGFDSALGICQSMGQEGWGLCMSGLTPLLRDCAEREDWTSGLAVWRHIQALKAKSKRFERGRWSSEVIRLDTYAYMLRLCCKSARSDSFDEVWEQACRAHGDSVDKLTEIVKMQSGVKEAHMSTGLQAESSQSDSHFALPDVEPSVQTDTDSDPMSHEVASGVKTTNNDHQDRNANVASQVMNGLKEAIPPSQAPESAQGASHEDAHTPPAWQNASRKNPASTARRVTPTAQPMLSREQLDGLLPASHELEDYELGERPMTMYG